MKYKIRIFEGAPEQRQTQFNAWLIANKSAIIHFTESSPDELTIIYTLAQE